ncbi:MAG: tail protein X [Pseudomonadota bacterium]
MIYRTIDGDMLDAICARHYGDADLAERVLSTNPGLAARGPIYPAGVEIDLPELTSAPVQLVRLWGGL